MSTYQTIHPWSHDPKFLPLSRTSSKHLISRSELQPHTNEIFRFISACGFDHAKKTINLALHNARGQQQSTLGKLLGNTTTTITTDLIVHAIHDPTCPPYFAHIGGKDAACLACRNWETIPFCPIIVPGSGKRCSGCPRCTMTMPLLFPDEPDFEPNMRIRHPGNMPRGAVRGARHARRNGSIWTPSQIESWKGLRDAGVHGWMAPIDEEEAAQGSGIESARTVPRSESRWKSGRSVPLRLDGLTDYP